ncbi:MAG: hypothetical protein EHM39_02865 [Chloroflexi bacterium]|nr:MAG: hypothetical protein EHM39_02865 [Chloroflexota bacterium]
MAETELIPPADPEMAAKLSINRTGRLTGPQRRTALIIGGIALLMLLCPVTLLVQMAGLLLTSDVPVATVAGVVFLLLGALFLIIFVGLIWVNVETFLAEAFMRQPVTVARGPLEIRVPERQRPELPFSYLVGDYSFAPYVAPPDVLMRVGAPYIIYYAARSRLLLSIAALDAPDAAQWLPAFE